MNEIDTEVKARRGDATDALIDKHLDGAIAWAQEAMSGDGT
jgi:hypothetical protein